MKFLEAFCAYMEGIADGIRLCLSVIAGILVCIAIISMALVKDIEPGQVAIMMKWALAFGVAGLFCPPEKTWFHWKIMAERKNEQ